MDALRHSLGFDGWVPAGGRGEVLSPGFQADPYATALPPGCPCLERPLCQHCGQPMERGRPHLVRERDGVDVCFVEPPDNSASLRTQVATLQARVDELQRLQDAWEYVNMPREVPVPYSELLSRTKAAEARVPAEPTGWRPEGAIKGTPGVEGLGERLKCVREMRRLTQADLAVKLEVPPAEVSHFETGQRLPGAKNLRKLCIALNVSADYLLDTQ